MAITAAERTELLKLVALMFNASPGATYLNELVNLYENLGHDLEATADVLDNLPLFDTVHPDFETAEEFAASFLAPLGLEGDSLATSFIVEKFNDGWSKGDIALAALDALENLPEGASSQYTDALAILNNMAAVSEYYSVTAGVQQTDLNVLQQVLQGITADASSVTTAEAEIDAGVRGVAGETFTLKPTQDTVVGTNAADFVNGLFGDVTAANNTYTSGDSIDGGDGNDTLTLVATGTTVSPAIVVKNVETISIQDTVGATFNALLVQSNPTITFTNTVKGQTSMVTNAGVGSTYGLSGLGNLTVGYVGTSGTADTAKLSLNGAGSSTVASAINVSATNTIEKVTIATAGTNNIALTAGTNAASVTVTGNGTNTIDVSGTGAIAAVATIDASASTGTNTFALGSTANITGSTIKGGTGADTVSATLSSATLSVPTFTGVETFSTTWTAYGILDLQSATGLTSVSVSDKAAASGTMTIQNAQSTVSMLTVSNVSSDAANSALKFGYGSSSKGDLTLKIGSTSATATAVDLGAVTISNSTGLHVTTLGALDHDMDGLTVKGNQTGLDFTVAADGGLTTGGVTATGSVGEMTLNLAAGSYFSGNVNLATPGKDLGDVTINVTGNKADAHSEIHTSGGSIGNVSLNITADHFGYGATSGADFAFNASGGSVGDVTVAITGDNNTVDWFGVSAGYTGSGSEGADIVNGNVGDISIAVNGDDNSFSGDIGADHGDIGNVDVTIMGDGNRISVSAYAEHGYYSAGTSHTWYDAGGGNIGDVNVTIDGDSSGYVGVHASGGAVGNITLSLDNDAYLDFYASNEFSFWYSGGPADGGNIGNITVTMGDDTGLSAYVSADSGDIGNVNITVNGTNASGYMALYALFVSGSDDGSFDQYDYNRGGNIGDISITIDGNDSNFQVLASASGGSIGDVAVSVNGTGASGGLTLRSHAVGSGSPGGNTGTVDITIGDDAGYWLGTNVDGTLGAVTVQAGDNSWFDMYVSGGYYSSPGLEGQYGDSAVVSSVNITMGDDAYVSVSVSGFSGSVGTITGSFGDNAQDTYHFRVVTGAVGALNLSYGEGADTHIYYGSYHDYGVDGFGNVNDTGTIGAVTWNAGAGSDFVYGVSGGAASIGKITLTGGDAGSSATINVENQMYTIGSAGGVDASAFAGSVDVNLSEVGAGSASPVGTTIKVGTGGSTVLGTEGADNIFLGTGVDTVMLDQNVDTNTKTDVVFNFTAGAGKDVLDVAATATTLNAVMTVDTADTAASGDVFRLVDITSPAGQDITTASGLLTALQSGEYASLDTAASAHFTIVTAASSSATTLYVFDVNDADGGADYDSGEVTLVGVINTTGGTISTVVLGNLA